MLGTKAWPSTRRFREFVFRRARDFYFGKHETRFEKLMRIPFAHDARSTRRMCAMSSALPCVSTVGRRGASSRIFRARTCNRSSRIRPRLVSASSGAKSGTAVPEEEHEAVAYRTHLFASVDLWSTSLRESLPGGGLQEAGNNTRMPRFTLTYMPMRNRCEVSRLIL